MGPTALKLGAKILSETLFLPFSQAAKPLAYPVLSSKLALASTTLASRHSHTGSSALSSIFKEACDHCEPAWTTQHHLPILKPIDEQPFSICDPNSPAKQHNTSQALGMRA